MIFRLRRPLGVACLVLALARPLTPYYVLNIGEENIELTGHRDDQLDRIADRDEEVFSSTFRVHGQYGLATRGDRMMISTKA